MPLRLLDSIVQIYQFQLRQWRQSHDSTAKLKPQPVLPIVLYTGTRSWHSVGTLIDLMDGGREIRDFTPVVERPCFLNLPNLDAESLDWAGHFGTVLKFLQQRCAKRRNFVKLLQSYKTLSCRGVAHRRELCGKTRRRTQSVVRW